MPLSPGDRGQARPPDLFPSKPAFLPRKQLTPFLSPRRQLSLSGRSTAVSLLRTAPRVPALRHTRQEQRVVPNPSHLAALPTCVQASSRAGLTTRKPLSDDVDGYSLSRRCVWCDELPGQLTILHWSLDLEGKTPSPTFGSPVHVQEISCGRSESHPSSKLDQPLDLGDGNSDSRNAHHLRAREKQEKEDSEISSLPNPVKNRTCRHVNPRSVFARPSR